jgi:ABC-2 type transport system permease protein
MSNSARRIEAIFQKELKDALKCPPVIISFFMLPVVILLVKFFLPDFTPQMLLLMFLPLQVVLGGILSCASIIAEEKEKNTLRVLIMSTVRPFEYLIGIASFVIIGQMIGSCIVAIGGEVELKFIGVYLLVTFLSNSCSVLLGAMIGILAKNQMSVAPLGVPVMLILSFVPLFASGNESVKKFGGFLFSQQLSNILSELNNTVEFSRIGIIIINLVVLFVLFQIVYKKNKLDN